MKQNGCFRGEVGRRQILVHRPAREVKRGDWPVVLVVAELEKLLVEGRKPVDDGRNTEPGRGHRRRRYASSVPCMGVVVDSFELGHNLDGGDELSRRIESLRHRDNVAEHDIHESAHAEHRPVVDCRIYLHETCNF